MPVAALWPTQFRRLWAGVASARHSRFIQNLWCHPQSRRAAHWLPSAPAAAAAAACRRPAARMPLSALPNSHELLAIQQTLEDEFCDWLSPAQV